MEEMNPTPALNEPAAAVTNIVDAGGVCAVTCLVLQQYVTMINDTEAAAVKHGSPRTR